MKEAIDKLELQEATPAEIKSVVYLFLSAFTLVALLLLSIIGMLVKVFG